jgi:hypothetical protein
VSDELAPSVARQPVYSASIRLLVYIIIVSGKMARPALPLLVPLRSTCGIALIIYPQQLFQPTQDVPDQEEDSDF